MASNANGALFKNTRKEEGTKQPDYNGNIEVTKEWLDAQLAELGTKESLKINISGWKKESRNGPYISMSVNAPFKKGQTTQSRRPPSNEDDPF